MSKGKSKFFGSKNENTKDEKDEKMAEETVNETTEMPVEIENLSGTEETPEEKAPETTGKTKEEELQSQVNELQDRYIRLMAEFDNFRKRTLKERMELLKSAGEDVLINVLPVVDDFERGLQAMERTEDVEALKLGVGLIYNKFREFLNQRGVKEIEAINHDFNVDIHEAITKIPAPEENLKGKVVDVLQKGYSLNEKVIRFAKVVVGE